jgi:hypothetical protein
MNAAAIPACPPPYVGHVTQARVVLSEWTKFRSLRSTVYTFVVGIGASILFAIIPAVINAVRWSTMSLQDKLAFNPLETTLIGVNVAQLAIGVLGVLMITGEYSTGMIRATFTAVPKRLPVLWAKVGVYWTITVIEYVDPVRHRLFDVREQATEEQPVRSYDIGRRRRPACAAQADAEHRDRVRKPGRPSRRTGPPRPVRSIDLPTVPGRGRRAASEHTMGVVPRRIHTVCKTSGTATWCRSGVRRGAPTSGRYSQTSATHHSACMSSTSTSRSATSCES